MYVSMYLCLCVCISIPKAETREVHTDISLGCANGILEGSTELAVH